MRILKHLHAFMTYFFSQPTIMWHLYYAIQGLVILICSIWILHLPSERLVWDQREHLGRTERMETDETPEGEDDDGEAGGDQRPDRKDGHIDGASRSLTDGDILDLCAMIPHDRLADLGEYLGFTITTTRNLEHQYQRNTKTVAERLLQQWKIRESQGHATREMIEEFLARPRSESPLKIAPPEKIHRAWISNRLSVDQCRQRLVDYYKRVTCKIQLRPWDKGHYVELRDLYTKINVLRMERTILGDQSIRKEPLPDSINDIFKTTVDGCHPTRILLLGPAGHGKTTAVAKMAYDWAHGIEGSPLKDVALVFVVAFRRTDKCTSLGKAILSQLLGNMKGVTPEDIEKFIDENEEECIVLLDGYDEYSGSITSEDSQSSLVDSLRYGILRKSRILVTSRPHRGKDFESEELARVYVTMEIEGFSNEDAERYIERFFSCNPDKGQEMNAFLQTQGIIGALVNVPFFCMMFCNLQEGDLLADTQTLTGVFDKTLKYLLQHYRSREHAAGRMEIDKIAPEKLKSVINAIGAVSLRGLLGDGKKILFTEEDFKDCTEDLEFGVNLGLLLKQTITQESDKWYEISKTYVEFYHKLAQEHCTGKYLASLSRQKLGEILRQLSEEATVMDFENVLRFVVGTSSESCSMILQHLYGIAWKQDGKIVNHKHRLLLDVFAETTICDEDTLGALQIHFARKNLDVTSTTASTLSGLGKLPDDIKLMINSVKIAKSQLSTKQTRSLWTHLTECGFLKHLSLSSSTLPADEPLCCLRSIHSLETSVLSSDSGYSAIIGSSPEVRELRVEVGVQETVDEVIGEVARGVQTTNGMQSVFHLGHLLFIGKSESIPSRSVTSLVDMLSHARFMKRLMIENLHVEQVDLKKWIEACWTLPKIQIIGIPCQEFDIPVSEEEMVTMMTGARDRRPAITCDLDSFLFSFAQDVTEVERKDWNEDFEVPFADNLIRVYVEYTRMDGGNFLLASKRYTVPRPCVSAS